MNDIHYQQPVDMSPRNIVGDYQQATIQHFDGHTRKILYTNEETIVSEGDKIISVTDPEGIIITANSAFIKVSGYTRKELLGTPHYILHHPDMPKAAFAGLWSSLAETGRWEGYVKNLRKDGGFYWVFAKIFSLHRDGKLVGYTSTRVAAERDQIAIYAKEYAKLLAAEKIS